MGKIEKLQVLQQSFHDVLLLVTYESTVDDFGEESGVEYVSRFSAVAKLQVRENTRLIKAKPAGSGYAGLDSCAQDVEQNRFNKYLSRYGIDGQSAERGLARCARQPGFQHG